MEVDNQAWVFLGVLGIPSYPVDIGEVAARFGFAAVNDAELAGRTAQPADFAE